MAKKRMRNKWIHYGGIIMAIIGVLFAAAPFGVAGINPQADVTCQVSTGIILAIVGFSLFLLIDE